MTDELKHWRRLAHIAFDPFVIGKERRTRRAAFEWLADEMGLPLNLTRIRLMDVDQCRQVVRICNEARRQHEQGNPDRKPRQ